MGCPSRISDGLRAWQAEWGALRELTERQVAAVRSSALAVGTLRDCSRAYHADLNSHPDGVAVVAILKLLDHLRVSTGLEPETAESDDLFDLIPAVRIAARAALDREGQRAAAHATLAELCLLSGDQASPADREEALAHCAKASVSEPDRQSLLERLGLFAALGFRPGLVSAAMDTLKRPPKE